MANRGGKLVRFTLIGVPSSAGTHGVGLEKAPLQLRRAGLVDRLLDAGLEVVDDGDLPLALYRPRSPDRTQQNLDQVVTVAGRVADRVAHTVATGRTRWCLAGTARSPWGWSPGSGGTTLGLVCCTSTATST
jgi:arginase